MERDVAIPEAIVSERAHIVAESDRLETAITTCVDVEELINVMHEQQWTTN